VVEPDDDQVRALGRREVAIEREPVVAIEGAAAVRLRDGRVVELAGVFLAPPTHVAGPLAGQLGCALDDGPLGAFLRVDPMQETTVRGVFACGDAAVAFGGIAFAVAAGARAGYAAHQSLIFR
jgi:thioredoxin reductase